MVRGDMVLTKGVRVGNLFHLEVCAIQFNGSSMSTVKIFVISTPSQSEFVSTYNGHAFWVAKQALP